MRQRSRYMPQEYSTLVNGPSLNGKMRPTFEEAQSDAMDLASQASIQTRLGGINQSMTDQLLPNFHELRRKGAILPTNVMNSSKVDMPQSIYVMQTSVYSASANLFAGYCLSGVSTVQPPGTRTILTDGQINSAKIEAIARLRQQGMDYLTSAAEFHKTVAMFLNLRRNLMSSIEKVARELRRRQRGRGSSRTTFKTLWDEFSSIWLEGRFGWRILYYDLVAITDYLNHMEDDTSFIVGRSLVQESTEVKGGGKLGSYHTYESVTTYTDSVRVGYPGMIDHKVLGNPSLLNTAWELIPFSLVLDWFFDIQSVIFAFANTPRNVKELPGSAFLSRKRTGIVVYNPIPKVYANHTVLDVKTSGPVVLMRETFSRNLPGSYSLGLTWKPSVNGLVWVDLFALLKPIYNVLTSVRR